MTEVENGKMKVKFFGESAYFKFGDEEEKKKAKEYLEFWKKNLLFKLRKDSFKPVIIENGEDWGERNEMLINSMDNQTMMYCKICVSMDFNYELGKYYE